jgi:hypothetical protein
MSRARRTAPGKIRTMRQAEEAGYRWMAVGGVVATAGLLLCLGLLSAEQEAILRLAYRDDWMAWRHAPLLPAPVYAWVLRAARPLVFGLCIPLLLGGMLIALADLGWMFWIMRRPTIEVRCPHCHARNLILSAFWLCPCDDCGQVIERPRAGHLGGAPGSPREEAPRRGVFPATPRA